MEIVYKKNNINSPVLTLDVGGTASIKATKALLTSIPGSLLERTFSGYHQHTVIKDKIFMDRDGPSFTHLINYLRLKRNYVPTFKNKNEEQLFLKELNFWGISPGQYEKDFEE